MFRIKICGITSERDLQIVVASGADAIGLNFYPPSARFIDSATARTIVDATPAEVAKVGVFVNSSVAEICAIYDALKLDFIQLHGDEPPEFLAQLAPRRVIRALGCGADGVDAIVAYLDECRSLDALPAALLIDAPAGRERGGTGRLAHWASLANPRPWLGDIPLILAGGLQPENVAEAIRAVQPFGVDTASGVESAPGQKDAGHTRQFVAAARRAFTGDNDL